MSTPVWVLTPNREAQYDIPSSTWWCFDENDKFELCTCVVMLHNMYSSAGNKLHWVVAAMHPYMFAVAFSRGSFMTTAVLNSCDIGTSSNVS